MTHLDDLFSGLPVHLTVEQLGGALGVTSSTAYRLLQTGVVPAYKVGGGWLIIRDEVRDSVAARRNTPDETGRS